MNSYFKKHAAAIAAAAVLSVSMASGVMAEENSVTTYVTSAAEAASSVDYSEVTKQLALYYQTTAELFRSVGQPVPADILSGLAAYGNVDVSAYLSAAADALDSASEAVSAAAAAGSSNTSKADSVMWMDQEDGTSLFYKCDPSTGEAKLYEGWYTDDSGAKYYFEKGKPASGWVIDDGKFYHLDMTTGVLATSKKVGNFYVGEDGAALMDTTAPDGTSLAYNGSCMISKKPIEELDHKTYIYRELLVKDPDLYAEFSARSSGSYQIMPENENGFAWYTYASMRLYERKEDGSIGKKVYEGDGCFRRDASIEFLNNDGTVSTMRPSAIVGSGHETWMAEHIHIDPAGFITYSEIKKDD
ncbi:hypothetical protein [Oribacterium sp. P6A1]|uniref:hypothetical protein n=1 Tax=Oribacterium sp. P6A1 TaxID=1410612 RepID=UPI0005655CAB|nr:hypothetical protein [Oribacterium sp. P6A1]